MQNIVDRVFDCDVGISIGVHDIRVEAQTSAIGARPSLRRRIRVSMYGVSIVRIWARTSAACAVTFLELGCSSMCLISSSPVNNHLDDTPPINAASSKHFPYAFLHSFCMFSRGIGHSMFVCGLTSPCSDQASECRIVKDEHTGVVHLVVHPGIHCAIQCMRNKMRGL